MGILKKLYHTLFIDEQEEDIAPVTPPTKEESEAEKSEQPPAPKPITAKENPAPKPEHERGADKTPSELERSTLELLEQSIPKRNEHPRKKIQEAAKKHGQAADQETPAETTSEQDMIDKLLADVDRAGEPSWESPPPFHLTSGHTVRGPADLAAHCAHMSQETYEHHAGGEQNDFATWIEDAFHDEEMAARVQDADNPQSLAQAITGEHPLPELSTDTDETEEDASVPPTEEPDLEGYQAEIEALRGQVKRLQDELGKELSSGLQALRDEKQRREELEDKLAEKQRLIQEKESALNEEQQRREELEEQTGQLREELESREDVLREERERRKTLEGEVKHLETELAKRDERIKHLETELDDTQKHESAERAHTQEKLEQKRAELARAKEALAAHKQQIRETQERLDELEGRAQQAAKKQPSTSEGERSPEAEHVLAKVRTARSQLDAGHIEAAKHSYTELRELFYNSALKDDEKHELYNLIRELYADIELAAMS